MTDKKKVSDADVIEALGILNDEQDPTTEDARMSKETLRNATPEQIKEARKQLNIPSFSHGGSVGTGAAIKGTKFSGTY
tara:strand:- start:12158 stop:12394 length:237 start_codon:yes stop_codon:yes gene_type:complete